MFLVPEVFLLQLGKENQCTAWMSLTVVSVMLLYNLSQELTAD